MKITVAGEVLEWGLDDLWDYLAQYGVVETCVDSHGAHHEFLYLSANGRGRENCGPYVMISSLNTTAFVDVMRDVGAQGMGMHDVRDAVEAWLKLCGKGVSK